MDIISLLANDNYIVVNKDLIKEFGINTALLLGELASEYKYYQKKDLLEDGYFYSTIENIEENTGLSVYQQKKSLDELKEQNFIDVIIKGLPAKRYIKLDCEILTNKFVRNSQTGLLETNKLDCEKLATNNNNINNNKLTIINNNKKEVEEKTIYDFVEENFNRLLTPIEYQKIEEWMMYYTEDIIKYAVEKSVYNNKKTFSYVNGILNNWHSIGYKTLQEIKENEEKPKQQTNNQYAEQIPEWYGKENDINEPTKEELEEFERKLEEIKNR